MDDKELRLRCLEIAERHFSKHEDIVFNAQKVYEFVIGDREYATRGGMNFEVEISEEQLGPGDVTYPSEQLIEDTHKANECEGLQRGKDSDLIEGDARKFFDLYEEDLREEYEQAQHISSPDAA